MTELADAFDFVIIGAGPAGEAAGKRALIEQVECVGGCEEPRRRSRDLGALVHETTPGRLTDLPLSCERRPAETDGTAETYGLYHAAIR